MVHTRKAGELPFDYDHTKETNKRNLNSFIFHQSQMWVAADVSARNCSAISRCPWIKAKQHFRSKKTTKKNPTPPHRFFLWRVRVGTEVNQLTVNKWLLWIWVKETGTLRNFIWLPLSLSHTHITNFRPLQSEVKGTICSHVYRKTPQRPRQNLGD